MKESAIPYGAIACVKTGEIVTLIAFYSSLVMCAPRSRGWLRGILVAKFFDHKPIFACAIVGFRD